MGYDLIEQAATVRMLSILVPVVAVSVVGIPLADAILRRVARSMESQRDRAEDGADGADDSNDDGGPQEVRSGGSHGWSDEDLIAE